MLDDEDYFEDEWLYDIAPDDSLAAWADDLVDRAMPLSVYVEDPRSPIEDYWSDWESYTDNYYDEDTTEREKATRNGTDSARNSGAKRKRLSEGGTERKMKRSKATKDYVESFAVRAGLNAPVVMWRQSEDPDHPPVFESQGEKVAVLKDWRERLRPSDQPDDDQIGLSRKPTPEDSKKVSKVLGDIHLGLLGAETQRRANSTLHVQGEEEAIIVSKGLNGPDGVLTSQKHAMSHSANMSGKGSMTIINGMKGSSVKINTKLNASRHGTIGATRKSKGSDITENIDTKQNKNNSSSQKKRLRSSVDEGGTNGAVHKPKRRT